MDTLTLIQVTDISGRVWRVARQQLESATPAQLTLSSDAGERLAQTLARTDLWEVADPHVAVVWALPVYARWRGDWESETPDPPVDYLAAPTPYQRQQAWTNYADGEAFGLYFWNGNCPQCCQPRLLTIAVEQISEHTLWHYRCYACQHTGSYRGAR